MAKRITKEEIEPLALECRSFRELTLKLGKAPVGSNITQTIERCKRFNIDTSHFLGKSHLRGTVSSKKKSADQVLILRTPEQGRDEPFRLRRALLEIGVEHKCSCCGIDKWCGKDIILQIDHIDGKFWNNQRENLRFLCPNCHTQTPTFGSQKRALVME